MKRTVIGLLCIAVLLVSVFSFASCVNENEKEELYTALSELLPAEGYTTASYKVYIDAYNNAKQVYLNEEATGLEVDTALKTLNSAKGSLVKTADFSQLKLAIEAHESIIAASYTSESYGTYLSAYNIALAVYQDDSSSQNEINSAVTSLNNAIRALVKIPDSSSLQQLLQNKVSSDGYTTASYRLYEEAYSNALQLIQDENAAKEELLLAENLLRQTQNALMKKGDTTPLTTVMREIEQQYLATDKSGREPKDYYTASSYAAFMVVYNECKTIEATSDASDNEIVLLGENLVNAAEKLVSIKGLLERIDMFAVYAAQSHYYTVESYENFAAAVSEAINIAKASNPTFDQVKAAEDKIDDALTKLERRELIPDHQTNKTFTNKEIKVGNSSVSFEDYMTDYAAFFEKVTTDNLIFAYYTEGDVAYIHYANADIVMRDQYIKMSYSGGATVSAESIFAASFGGISFDKSEFDFSAEENFGTPTEYSKRTEIVMGMENSIATIVYSAQDGSKMTIEYNTIYNFIISIELVNGGADVLA